MTTPNGQLKSGSPVTWTQYPSRTARHEGRQRTGWFWSLAPGPSAIWVRPDHPEPGEPVAVKVYRTLRGLTAEAVAFDDDLTAAAS